MVSQMIRLAQTHCPRRAAAALITRARLPAGLVAAQTAAQGEDGGRRGTGLPLPRFVSLKSNNVNVRRGPGQDYDVAFTFVRAGLPVEITDEFDNWRKIRDSEGSEGWVFHSLLSGKRTAIVAPWEAEGQFAGAQHGRRRRPRSSPICSRASSPTSRNAPAPGAWSAATALKAGSSRSGCGASIPDEEFEE